MSFLGPAKSKRIQPTRERHICSLALLCTRPGSYPPRVSPGRTPPPPSSLKMLSAYSWGLPRQRWLCVVIPARSGAAPCGSWALPTRDPEAGRLGRVWLWRHYGQRLTLCAPAGHRARSQAPGLPLRVRLCRLVRAAAPVCPFLPSHRRAHRSGQAVAVSLVGLPSVRPFPEACAEPELSPRPIPDSEEAAGFTKRTGVALGETGPQQLTFEPWPLQHTAFAVPSREPRPLCSPHTHLASDPRLASRPREGGPGQL